MAKSIKQKEKILCIWLKEYAETRNCPEWEYDFIADTERRHYQVVRMGWEKGIFRYYVIFHLQIKDTGKVWLYVNETDIEIDEELAILGIPFSDMVIAFHPPTLRPHTKYAVG